MLVSYLPIFVVVAISLTVGTVSTLTKGFLSKRYGARIDFLAYINIITGIVGACTIALLSMGNFKVSSFTALLALAFTSAIMIQMMTNQVAFTLGPISYTSLVMQFSTVITAFSGAIFWNEKLSVFTFIGLAFMVACMVMSVDLKKEDGARKKSIGWIAFTLISMLSNASIGIFQKIHQTSEHKDELPMFLILAFLYMVVFSAILRGVYGIIAAKRGLKPLKTIIAENHTDKKWLFPVLLVGLGIAFGTLHVVNLYLSGQLPSAIMFPLVNGGVLVFTLILTATLLKEKLSKKQLIGVCIGIVGLVLLCIEGFIK